MYTKNGKRIHLLSGMIIQNENIQGCEKLWIPLILNT
jgi:hypothetical protein